MKQSILAFASLFMASTVLALPYDNAIPGTLLSRSGECKNNSGCPSGMCCSKYGYCGTGAEYCGGNNGGGNNPPPGNGGGNYPGLDATQSRNAKAAIGEVKKEGLGRHACLAVISTALQESTLHIYANPRVPASMNYPHDLVGGDQDSVGMFQQRPQWYPDIAADMSAAGSTRQFLAAMKQVPNWQNMEISALDQAVQKAEAGNLYAKRIPLAKQVCTAAGL